MEIETLIARGRRVRRPKEQREVAFSFAKISTDLSSHAKIVKKGGCKALIQLLNKSKDRQAQRYAALCIANVSSTKENQLTIPPTGMIPVLLDYLVREVDGASSQAMSSSDHPGEEEAKDDQLETSVVGDSFGQAYCAMALGNLAFDPVNHEEIVKLQGLRRFVKLLRHDNPYCGRFAAFAIGNLAVNEMNREEIVKLNGIPLLVELACYMSSVPSVLNETKEEAIQKNSAVASFYLDLKEEIEVQKAALGALRRLSIDPQLREAIVRHGGIDPLIILEKKAEDMSLRLELACAFNCLSSVEQNKLEICDRALSTILALALSDVPQLQQQAMCALANLLEDSALHEPIVAENGLPVIISLACADDQIIQAEAARALAHLSANATEDFHYQRLMYDEGGLSPIIKIIANRTKAASRFSALCVGNFATNLQFQAKLMQLGAPKNLVDLLGDREADVAAKRYACFAIGNLLATPANHVRFLELGVLSNLFALANASDERTQYYVAVALSNLCSKESNHTMIIEKGGLQPLVSLMFSNSIETKIKAVGAIHGISFSTSNLSKIISEGGLEPIVATISELSTLPRDLHPSQCKQLDLLKECTAALANLLVSEVAKHEMSRTTVTTEGVDGEEECQGFLETIVDMITRITPVDLTLQKYLLMVLAKATEIKEAQQLLGQSKDIFGMLIQMLNASYSPIQREGLNITANMCCQHRCCEKVLNHNLHKILVPFLSSSDVLCQRPAIIALKNLSLVPKFRKTLVDIGLVSELGPLLISRAVEVEIRRFCLTVLINLSSSEMLQPGLLEAGVISMLTSVTECEDETLRQLACLCLSKFAQNIQLATELTKHGAVEPILYLCRIKKLKMSELVLPGLYSLSTLPCNRLTICKYGGGLVVESILTSILKVAAKKKVSRSLKQVLKLALATASNLSEEAACHETLIEFKVAELLCQLLSCSTVTYDSELYAGLLYTVAALCGSPMTHRYFLSEAFNVLLLVLDVLKGTERVLIQHALLVCGNLTANMQSLNHPLMLSILPDLVKVLVDILTELTAEGQAAVNYIKASRIALLCLANIAVVQKHSELMLQQSKRSERLQPSFLAILVGCLKFKDLTVRNHAVFLLNNLASRSLDFAEHIESTALSPIVTAALSTDYSVRSCAVSTMKSFAQTVQHRVSLYRESALEPLMMPLNPFKVKEMLFVEKDTPAPPDVLRTVDNLKCTLEALYNLTLHQETRIGAVKAGLIPLLCQLLNVIIEGAPTRQLRVPESLLWSICELSLGLLQSLSELLDGYGHEIMFEEKLPQSVSQLPASLKALEALHTVIGKRVLTAGVKLVATITCSPQSAVKLLSTGVMPLLRTLLVRDDGTNYQSKAHRTLLFFSSVALGNIALNLQTHKELTDGKNVALVAALNRSLEHDKSGNASVVKGILYFFCSLAANNENHWLLYKMGVITNLLASLGSSSASFDSSVVITAVTALRLLATDSHIAEKVVELGVLVVLQQVLSKAQRIAEVATTLSIEVLGLLRELLCLLRNLSITDVCKAEVIGSGMITTVLQLFSIQDEEILHQLLCVLANLTENETGQTVIARTDILSRLKLLFTATASVPIELQRESVRLLSNLLSNAIILPLLSGQGVIPLLHCLMSRKTVDVKLSAYVLLCLYNVTTSQVNHERLMRDDVFALVTDLVLNCQDLETKKIAMLCLVNFSSNERFLGAIYDANVIPQLLHYVYRDNFSLTHPHFGAADTNSSVLKEMIESMIIVLSNFASCSRFHKSLMKLAPNFLADTVNLLANKNVTNDAKLFLTSILRGFSCTERYRESILQENGVQVLLEEVARLQESQADTLEFSHEIMHVLIHLSLTGCFGAKSHQDAVLNEFDSRRLLCYLASADSTYNLFGAITLGSLSARAAGNQDLLSRMAEGYSGFFLDCNLEVQRAISYGVMNLLSDEESRLLILGEVGMKLLTIVLSLLQSSNRKDKSSALVFFRCLSVEPRYRKKLFSTSLVEYVNVELERQDDLSLLSECLSIYYYLTLDEEIRDKILLRKKQLGYNLLSICQQENILVSSMATALLANILESQKNSYAFGLFPAAANAEDVTMPDFQGDFLSENVQSLLHISLFMKVARNWSAGETDRITVSSSDSPVKFIVVDTLNSMVSTVASDDIRTMLDAIVQKVSINNQRLLYFPEESLCEEEYDVEYENYLAGHRTKQENQVCQTLQVLQSLVVYPICGSDGENSGEWYEILDFAILETLRALTNFCVNKGFHSFVFAKRLYFGLLSGFYSATKLQIKRVALVGLMNLTQSKQAAEGLVTGLRVDSKIEVSPLVMIDAQGKLVRGRKQLSPWLFHPSAEGCLQYTIRFEEACNGNQVVEVLYTEKADERVDPSSSQADVHVDLLLQELYELVVLSWRTICKKPASNASLESTELEKCCVCCVHVLSNLIAEGSLLPKILQLSSKGETGYTFFDTVSGLLGLIVVKKLCCDSDLAFASSVLMRRICAIEQVDTITSMIEADFVKKSFQALSTTSSNRCQKAGVHYVLNLLFSLRKLIGFCVTNETAIGDETTFCHLVDSVFWIAKVIELASHFKAVAGKYNENELTIDESKIVLGLCKDLNIEVTRKELFPKRADYEKVEQCRKVICREALGLLRNLTSLSIRTKISAEKHLLSFILDRIEVHDKEQCRLALATCANLAEEAVCRKHLLMRKHLRWPTLLVRLMNRRDRECLLETMRLLSNLVAEYGIQKQVKEVGGFMALRSVTRIPCLLTQYYASVCWRRISALQRHEQEGDLRLMECVTSLLLLLDRPFADLDTSLFQPRQAFAMTGSLPAPATQLSVWLETRLQALTSLSSLCTSPEQKHAVFKTDNCLRILVQNLRLTEEEVMEYVQVSDIDTSEDASVQEQLQSTVTHAVLEIRILVLGALASLAIDPRVKQNILMADLEPSLLCVVFQLGYSTEDSRITTLVAALFNVVAALPKNCSVLADFVFSSAARRSSLFDLILSLEAQEDVVTNLYTARLLSQLSRFYIESGRHLLPAFVGKYVSARVVEISSISHSGSATSEVLKKTLYYLLMSMANILSTGEHLAAFVTAIGLNLSPLKPMQCKQRRDSYFQIYETVEGRYEASLQKKKLTSQLHAKSSDHLALKMKNMATKCIMLLLNQTSEVAIQRTVAKYLNVLYVEVRKHVTSLLTWRVLDPGNLTKTCVYQLQSVNYTILAFTGLFSSLEIQRDNFDDCDLIALSRDILLLLTRVKVKDAHGCSSLLFDVIYYTLTLLTNISELKDNQWKFVKDLALVEALKRIVFFCQDTRSLMKACAVLVNLACNTGCRARLFQVNVHYCITKLLDVDTLEANRIAWLFFYNMSCIEQFHTSIISLGGRFKCELRENKYVDFGRVATTQEDPTAVQHQILVRLIHVIKNSKDLIARKYCLMAAANLLFNEHVREVLLAARMIPTLIPLLAHSNDTIRKYTLLCLVNASNDSQARKAMVLQGVMTFIERMFDAVHLKTGRDTTSLCLALWANLATSSENHELMIGPTLLTVVSHVLGGAFNMNPTLCILAGANFCSSTDEQVLEKLMLAECGCSLLERLVSHLSVLEPNVVSLLTTALKRLSQFSTFVPYLLKTELLRCLNLQLNFLQHLPRREILRDITFTLFQLSLHATSTHRIEMATSDALATLALILGKSKKDNMLVDQEIAKYGFATFANVAEIKEAVPYITTSFISSYLCETADLSANKVPIFREILRLLQNIMTLYDSHLFFVQRPSLLVNIAHLGRVEDLEILRHLSGLLCKLSTNTSVQMQLISLTFIEIYPSLLSVEDLEVSLQCLQCLLELSRQAKYRQTLAEERLLSAICAKLVASNLKMRKVAVEVVANLTKEERLKAAAPRQCKNLFRFLRQCSKTRTEQPLELCFSPERVSSTEVEQILIGTTQIYANLSEFPANTSQFLDNSAIESVTQLAQLHPEGCARDAVRCLSNLLSSEAVALEIYHAQCFPLLHRLVSQEGAKDHILCRYAMLGLRYLATASATRSFLISDDHLPELLELCVQLRHILDSRVVSAIVLKSFCQDPTLFASETQVLKALVTELLSNIAFGLQHHEATILAESAESLAFGGRDQRFLNICFKEDLKEQFLKTLLKLILNYNDDSESAEVIRNVARFVYQVSVTSNYIQCLVTQDGLRSVFNLLSHKDDETLQLVAATISNLCFSKSKSDLIEVQVQCGDAETRTLLSTLLDFLRNANADLIKSACICIVGLGLGHTGNKKKLIDKGVMHQLSCALQYPDPELMAASCLAVSCLVLDRSQRSKLAVYRAGAHVSIMNLLYMDLGEVEQVAEQSHENARLLTVLSTQRLCVKSAIYCLGSLCQSEEIKAGFLEPFMSSLPCSMSRTETEQVTGTHLLLQVIHLIQSIADVEVKRAGLFLCASLCHSSFLPDLLVALPQALLLEFLAFIVVQSDLEDLEVQEYCAFCLAHLASQYALHRELVSAGALTRLINLVNSEKDPKYYASLALMKLASNYENHIPIAEAGGIQALLKLTKSRKTQESLKYKATLCIGQLATNLVARERKNQL